MNNIKRYLMEEKSSGNEGSTTDSQINCVHGKIVNKVCNCEEGWITSGNNNYEGRAVEECNIYSGTNTTTKEIESSISYSFLIFVLLLFIFFLFICGATYLRRRKKKKNIKKLNNKIEKICAKIESADLMIIEMEAKKTLGIKDDKSENKTDVAENKRDVLVKKTDIPAKKTNITEKKIEITKNVQNKKAAPLTLKPTKRTTKKK